MKSKPVKRKLNTSNAGFSLVEMLVVVAIFSIILGAIFKQIEAAQQRYQTEDQKLDLTQQTREFIDQFTRDVHQSGFPSQQMYANRFSLVTNPEAHAANSNLISAGLWFVSPTDVAFEGDLDGLGNVQVIQYHYDDGSTWNSVNGPNPCPCIRRSSVAKIAGNPWDQTAPIFYTEVQNLVAPTANTPIFSFYQANGNPVTVPAGTLKTNTAPPIQQPICTTAPCGIILGDNTNGIDRVAEGNLQAIKTIRINLTTQGKRNDAQTGQSIQVNMVGSARLPNN